MRLELDKIYIVPYFIFLYEFLPTGANNTVLQKPLGLSLERMIRISYKICWGLKIIAYVSVIYLTGRYVSNTFRYPKDFKVKSHGVKHCLCCLFKKHICFLSWT